MHAWRALADAFPARTAHRTLQGSLAHWHACMIGYHRVFGGHERGHADVQMSAVAVLDAVEAAGDKVEFFLWVSACWRVRGDEAEAEVECEVELKVGAIATVQRASAGPGLKQTQR